MPYKQGWETLVTIAAGLNVLVLCPVAILATILLTLLFYQHHEGGMQYPVDSRNIGALLGLIETCIWLYMSQSNSLLLLLTEDYLEPCRSMLCPV